MKSIPIQSCHACDPKVWKPVGESEGNYKCAKCGRETNKILRRIEK